MKKKILPNYDHPTRENSRRKTRKLPILAKGGRGGYPGLVKDQYISVFFFWRLPLDPCVLRLTKMVLICQFGFMNFTRLEFKVLSLEILGLQKFWVQKNFDSKFFLEQIKFWVWQKFWVQKHFWTKNLRPR